MHTQRQPLSLCSWKTPLSSSFDRSSVENTVRPPSGDGESTSTGELAPKVEQFTFVLHLEWKLLAEGMIGDTG